VNPSKVAELGSEGVVEAFPLTRPSENNGYLGVTVYLDEIGQLKRLPLNTRAASIASICGFKGVSFAGDVFLGRISSNSRYEILNIDFKVTELRSDASWLVNAERENFEFGLKANRVTMDNDDIASSASERSDNSKGFSWSESAESIEIHFVVKSTAEVSTPKDLEVNFRSSSVHVKSKKTLQTLLQLKLVKQVAVDDCTWTCNMKAPGGALLTIYLEKSVSGLWNSLEASDV
jgi:hypothetical protein